MICTKELLKQTLLREEGSVGINMIVFKGCVFYEVPLCCLSSWGLVNEATRRTFQENCQTIFPLVLTSLRMPGVKGKQKKGLYAKKP